MTITLAATLSNAGRNDEALDQLRAAIDALDMQVRRGRGDLEQSLALGQMNFGLAALRARKLPEAEQALNNAIDCFQRLYDCGREDIRGWLGHAQLIRTEVLFRSGQESAAAADREAGFAHLDALTAQNVPIARLIAIRKAFDTAAYLPDSDSAHRLNQILCDLHEQCENIRVPERFLHELRTGLGRIEPVRSKLMAAGLDDVRLQKLEKRLESC